MIDLAADMDRLMRLVQVHQDVRARVLRLPCAAWGVVMVRPDRPERRALYGFNGILRSTFAQDTTDRDIRDAIACIRLEMWDDGTVWEIESERE